MSRLAATALLVLTVAACGVKAPPRPPGEAKRAAGAAATVVPGSGGGDASQGDCDPAAAREQGEQR